MRPQDFAVGWICALDTEFIAACELLDEEYDVKELSIESRHDDNAYQLGRIGDHHIVIACLPKGRYGIVSAASVAKDMLRSFEYIRIGLMVGIGGGAPSEKHDIRLGDIVVGCPLKTEGGVIPYNFGKAIQDQEFERTGSLNSPPTVLLTALTKLSAYQTRKGSQLAKSVQKMITDNSRLRGEFQHPGTEHDKLYESNYIHRLGDKMCEMCCDSASPPLLQRPRRPHPVEPLVHYGLIASADTLMKDAVTRDNLTKKHNILCFETEAAGLMNNFPCVVIRGICDYSDSHKTDAWQGYAAAIAASYAKELLENIPGHQIACIQNATAEMVRDVFSVPYEKDLKFIGRKPIFTQIEEQLRAHHRTSLCGIGGVGKSQIAIEYAYRFRQSRPQSHVFWVYAASSETFLQAYREIARSLRLPGYYDPNIDPYDLVLEWLKEEDHKWLMILDNADNPDLFFPPVVSSLSPATSTQSCKSLKAYLPSVLDAQKSMLITTRCRPLGEDLAHGGLCIEVPPFSNEEAKELLGLRMKGTEASFEVSETERLLDILGNIPLAITQAAAFIKRNRVTMTMEGYTAALERDRQGLMEHMTEDLQDHRRQLGYPNAIFLTWKLSFDQILLQEPKAAELLSLVAMLDPKGIPETLLRPLAETDVELTTAIGTLNGFALMGREIRGKTYSIHPLVQASVHYWLDQRREKATYVGMALQTLAEAFPRGWFENREACEAMLVHAQAVLCYDCVSKGDHQNRAMLLYKVGWIRYEQGRYHAAYQAVHASLEISSRKQMGEFAIETLNNQYLLAIVLCRQGMYEASEETGRRTLKGFERTLGANHENTLAMVSLLANVLVHEGEYEAGEELIQRALKGYEELYGPNSPETLVCACMLARVFKHQQKFDTAQKMSIRVLIGMEKVLGAEHPTTLSSVIVLAVGFHLQGRYDAAEKLYLRALKGMMKVAGSEHCDVWKAAANLALLYKDLELYNTAAIFYSGTLSGLLKTIGVNHPSTQKCSREYSELLHKMLRAGLTFSIPLRSPEEILSLPFPPPGGEELERERAEKRERIKKRKERREGKGDKKEKAQMRKG